MTVYKCHSCQFYQINNKNFCVICGVNNRLEESFDTEILADISNKLTRIMKGK